MRRTDRARTATQDGDVVPGAAGDLGGTAKERLLAALLPPIQLNGYAAVILDSKGI